ncbi:phosphotransferase family protein [Vagococcus coleopterorum]|uniref:Phosphotransferase family protein n=1 Tax=Vagococcus coleopterorum TaxID=2714946 RepID=A0A6G8AL99_9ENTE|nr:phosphotransferase family protein [Vagococcus coleopterorum]QIL45703.1 phosphotransferase family protein [Vagococcus coleopterorum]
MEANLKFDNKWLLQPIAGDTGQAYMGTSDNEKMFIKRNSPPFLAILSREGIAPKLMWTKRLGNGDVLTAQEWLDGDLLTSENLGNHLGVVQILQHLHGSENLADMLEKVGGKKMQPLDFLSSYITDLPFGLKDNKYLESILEYLEHYIPEPVPLSACHGDPIHNNWLQAADGHLYLVDWDSSMLADPASDLGTILGRYVDHDDWTTWLHQYGIPNNKENMDRIYWYCGMNFLLRIKHYYLQGNFKQVNKEIALLKKIFIY